MVNKRRSSAKPETPNRPASDTPGQKSFTPKNDRSSDIWKCDSCSSYTSSLDAGDHACGRFHGVSHAMVNKNGTLLRGRVRDRKLPEGLQDGKLPVIFLSPQAIRLCGFLVGKELALLQGDHEWHCVTVMPDRTLPPFDIGAVSSFLRAGTIAEVHPMKTPVETWDWVSFDVSFVEAEEQEQSRRKLLKDELALTAFLRAELQGCCLHARSTMEVDFFGQKLSLGVDRISPCEETEDDTDLLASTMERLDMNDDEEDDSFVTLDETGFEDSIKAVPLCMSTPYRPAKKNPPKRPVTRKSPPVFLRIGRVSRIEVKRSGGYGGGQALPKEKKVEERVRREDIAGLDHVLLPLFECIEKAQSRASTGPFPPPVGVLLHGPSGTGKSLIGKYLSAEYADRFVPVSASSLFSKYMGETETALKAKFDEAKTRAPSILFIDDVETLCSKKSEAGNSGSEQEGRVLGALVAALDSLGGPPASGVLVIATTSKLSSIDPSVRRPGRFDRELELGVPTVKERAAILKTLLSKAVARDGVVIADEEVELVARAAHGYVGADLALVCAEAASMAAKERRVITGEDLKVALKEVKPSAMREIFVDVPQVKWTDIGGMEDLKLKLKQSVSWPLSHPEAFERMGVRPPRGLLMYGPPGCSKTLFAKALACESGLNFVAIKGPELFSKWVGESEAAVREVFRKARRCAPSIIFFDEIDAIAGSRGSSQSSSGGANVQERVLAQLLTEMDGVVDLRDVVVVAATNRPDMVDPALLRPGRLDRIVYVPLPDTATRCQIFQIHLRKTPISSDVSFEDLAEKTNGYSGAEIVAVCQEAAMQALQESLDAVEVTQKHFLHALDVVRPRLGKEDLLLYDRYSNRAQ